MPEPDFFQHPSSDVKTRRIGARTRIWQYCVILSDAEIGEDCNICANVLIEGGTRIGSRVTVKSGVQIWEGVELGDDVFVGPNVTFTNDPYPRSRQKPERFTRTIIHEGASIGANATILAGVTIGRKAMVGAGAVVTRDVPAFAIVKGNPARISGYDHGRADRTSEISFASSRVDSGTALEGVELIHLKSVKDLRGELLAVEFEKQIPFPVRRVFYVMNVPSHHVRGEHAHLKCHQALVCLQGSIRVEADNGRGRHGYLLDSPEKCLWLKPMIWASQFEYSQNSVLAVFASHGYDPDDYIRDYEDFVLEWKKISGEAPGSQGRDQ